jgi:hypothetical protein
MARRETRCRILAGPASMARMATGRSVLAGPAPMASVGSRAAAGPGLTGRRAAGPRAVGRTRARCRVLGHPMPAVGAAAARHGAPTSKTGTVNGEAAGGPPCGRTRRRVLAGRTRRRVLAGRTWAGRRVPSLMSTVGAAARHGAPTGRARTVNGEAAGGPLCGGTRRRVRPGQTRAGRRVPCGATRRRVPVGTAPANGDALPRRWTGRSYTTGRNGEKTAGSLT